MRNILISIVALSVCGCSFWETQTPEQKAVLIKGVTKSALIMSINNAIKDDLTKLVVANRLHKIATKSIEFINTQFALTGEELHDVLDNVLHKNSDFYLDPVVVEALKSSIEYALVSLELPDLHQFVSPEVIFYLTAFFEGVKEGAELFMKETV